MSMLLAILIGFLLFDCMMLILIVFVLATCSIAQKFRMDYMWAQNFKTFYRLHNMATTWHQARQICESEGTNLLTPDNVEEMENLKLLISNMKAHYTGIFIGLHNQFSNGHYVNLQGKPIKGTLLDLLWGQGLPDNVNGKENCAIMTREGLFDDKPCDDSYPFVCKILGEHTRYNQKCDNFDMGYFPADNGKCYKFHDEPLTWPDAFLVCKSEEGQLTILNSPEEAALVTKYLGEHLNTHIPDPNILLVGFSDIMFPLHYRTINGQTLEEAGYASWSPLSDDIAAHPEAKRCGAISRTGYLELTSCDNPAMFICEKNISNIPTTTPSPPADVASSTEE